MKYLVSLYQLNKTDDLREHLKNKLYENVQKEYPTKASLLRFYRVGYDFKVETNKHHKAFLKDLLYTSRISGLLGEDFSGYPVGVTDIVCISEDSPKSSRADWYYCDTYGWKEMY